MKTCSCCHIKVNTTRHTCPICYRVLDDDNLPLTCQSYPSHQVKHRMGIVTKICLLLSVVAIISCILVNVYTISQGIDYYWSIIVIASIIYLWILGKYVVYGHGVITSRIISAMINASVVIFLVEAFIVKSNEYWFSLDMVIPFMIIGSILTVLIIMGIKKELINDTLFPLFGLTLLSMLPILLVNILNLKSYVWPVVACAGVGGVTLIYMLIFHFANVTEEFKKRLHF